jgi:hypothetical protein
VASAIGYQESGEWRKLVAMTLRYAHLAPEHKAAVERLVSPA